MANATRHLRPQDMPSFSLDAASPNEEGQASVFFGRLDCSSRDKTVKPKLERSEPRSNRCNSNRNSILDLPGEIRNAIYRHVLPCGNKVDISVYRDTILSDEFSYDCIKPIPGLVPLLQTCRQIYHEAGTLFYRTNSFNVRILQDYQFYQSIPCVPDISAISQFVSKISGALPGYLPILPAEEILQFPPQTFRTCLRYLTIDVLIKLYTGRRQIIREMVPEDPRIEKLNELEEKLNKEMIIGIQEIYHQAKTTWEEKNCAWEGTCFWVEDNSATYREGRPDNRSIE